MFPSEKQNPMLLLSVAARAFLRKSTQVFDYPHLWLRRQTAVLIREAFGLRSRLGTCDGDERMRAAKGGEERERSGMERRRGSHSDPREPLYRKLEGTPVRYC